MLLELIQIMDHILFILTVIRHIMTFIFLMKSVFLSLDFLFILSFDLKLLVVEDLDDFVKQDDFHLEEAIGKELLDANLRFVVEMLHKDFEDSFNKLQITFVVKIDFSFGKNKLVYIFELFNKYFVDEFKEYDRVLYFELVEIRVNIE